MTSNRFFAAKASVHEDRVELEGREHHHLSRVARVKAGDRVRLVDEDGTDHLSEVEEVRSGVTRLRILVGPEGGWAPDEEEAMTRNGCEAVSLGERVMRAETAALCAALTVILMWNR